MKTIDEMADELAEKQMKAIGPTQETCVSDERVFAKECIAAGLQMAAEAACRGCLEKWPVETIGGDPMHKLPVEKVAPSHGLAGTHEGCEAWAILALKGGAR